jgi:hypothetical protein
MCLMIEWNIQSRSEVCQATGRPFSDKEEFYTLLYESPEGHERMDLCQEAFEKRDQDRVPLSFWKSEFEPAPPPEAEAVDKNDAESELRRLISGRDPSQAKLCYLLALLLERKRILKAREKVVTAEGRLIVYEHSGTQESFVVPEVQFKLSELDALRTEVTGGASRIFAMVSKLPDSHEAEASPASTG